jgi:6-phosphogluconolactonase
MVNATPFRFKRLFIPLLAAASVVGTLLTPTAALADGPKKAVHTITNSATGNEVLAFHRANNGALTSAGRFTTGGNGSGAGLGSGHSLVVSDDGRELVVVNAGSNTISAFKVKHDGLSLIGQPAPSGGTRPTSVTIHNDLVYVLNADSTSIAGFKLDDNRGLAPIAGSIRSLGAGTMTPSQIQFDKTGHVLIVDARLQHDRYARRRPSRRRRSCPHDSVERRWAIRLRRRSAWKSPVLRHYAGRGAHERRHLI